MLSYKRSETSARARYVFAEAEFRETLGINANERIALMRQDETAGTVTVFTRPANEEEENQ